MIFSLWHWLIALIVVQRLVELADGRLPPDRHHHRERHTDHQLPRSGQQLLVSDP